ncbi:MAG: SDR family oxidoreductase [Frankiaceae bacterium]|nr:SDR family oxidoreductase [Frankiaceae bacterium]
MRVLVTGATGYIGGRLVPRLLAEGHCIRAMTRDASRLRDVPWASDVEVVEGDALGGSGLEAALAGMEVAYYLVHSIGDGEGAFEDVDRLAATAFGAAAKAAGVGRIVYLGGLNSATEELSPHLASRAEVGTLLLESGVPTAVLQAAVIIGSGSASFEMLRYLTERLPAMITPKWVNSRIQPIAVRDVLRYLVAAATLPPEVSRRFDIGGPEVLTYLQMMQRYAKVAGLRKRLIIPVPLLTPRLSGHWVNIVTPVPASLAKPLVRSLVNEVICSESDIKELVPDPAEGLLGFEDSVRLALLRVREAAVETRWSNATWPGAPSDPLPSDPDWAGGSLYEDLRQRQVDADPQDLWKVIEGIGGEHGWYSFPLAWAVRGQLDRLIGGVGLRRGRRDPNELYVGESLDFWRVEEIVDGQLLRLRAEMKVPGAAWLELRVEQDEDGRTLFVQRALFHPRGLAGHAYWWSVAPFHGVVFGGMLQNIAGAAQRACAERRTAVRS